MKSRRVAAAARWLAPSLIAACLAAALAGLIEGVVAGFGAIGAPASAGYAGLLAAPAALLGALLVRGLWAAWRPHRLAPALIEPGGGAPRLAAWIAYLGVAAVLLAWVTFNGVRTIARFTTFKVDVVSLGLPIFVLTAAAILAALSRPAVDVLAAGLRALDARLARRAGRSLLAPRLILAGTIGFTVIAVLVAWFATIKPRLGGLDAGILLHPFVALAITGLVHPLWRRLDRARWSVAGAAVLATAVVVTAALWVRVSRPSLMLSIWAEPSIGGLAIETLFDVDTLRSRASLEKYRPVARAGAPRRDIVLITIDTVRMDRTPLAGGKADMPTLARLGREGAVFERAYAPSNVTRRSMPAMMLGASPPRVRGRVVGWALRLDPRHVPLAERLQAAGYDTAGFFCCSSFWGADKKTGYARGLEHVFIDPDGDLIAAEARRWIDERYAAPRRAPAFAWLHFIEPHNWMKRKDGGTGGGAKDSKLRRYDKALAEVDSFLAVVIAAIDAIPAEQRPIVIIASDHGEGLGDHGAPYHSSDLFDTQLRVPLVIRGPGVTGRRIAETVSLTDLAPTILDLAGFVPPTMPDMDGRSLADLARGAATPDPDGGVAYAAMMKDRSSSQAARAVVRGRWKLIEDASGLALYDTRSDPGETQDRADDLPDLVAELRALLDERAAIDAIPPFQ